MEVTIDVRSVGVIKDARGILGTGCVVNNKRQIVTCAHVLKGEGPFYYVTDPCDLKGPHNFQLRIVKIVNDRDLAILEAALDVTETPLLIQQSETIELFSTVYYMGFSSELSSSLTTAIQINTCIVGATGFMGYGKDSTDPNYFRGNFIEFGGVAKPGFSGAPVLNESGRIVGILREGWYKVNYGQPDKIIINRTVSALHLHDIPEFKKE